LAINDDKPSLLRTLLVLGRVSNLPTVWSNCLAGWLIAGGGDGARFLRLCVGASLLYIGGMFLNDACDVAFDRQHRRERPIPAGAISSRAVWILSAVWLGLGAAVLLLIDASLVFVTLGLLACILVYNLLHKRTGLAPIFMGGCRFMLYVVAGAAATHAIPKPLISSALAMALYVVGLSYVARTESRSEPVNPCAVPLLLAPIVMAALVGGIAVAPSLLWVCFLGWVLFALHPLTTQRPGAAGQTVSRLLAGIALVDMLAAPGGPDVHTVAFALLFGSALILQRTAPTTSSRQFTPV